jgi:glycosyltransferase involved in cell wall biosynthesis
MMPSTSPIFSIATPTCNSLAKLRRCVGSVRGQTAVSYEHLIHDACSSDGTPEWLAQQTQVRAVSEPDAGMYDAINRAWSLARGKYLSWLNSDEQYLPGTLAWVERYFAAHPEVDALFGDYIVAGDDGRPIALRREIPLRAIYVKNTFLNAVSCTAFFRRRLFDRGQLRLDARYRYAADQDLFLRLLKQGAVIRHVPRYLAIFGIDGNNLSNHERMQVESVAIGRSHGALGLRPLRHVLLAARRVERLLKGAYRPAPIRYRFATNEIPDYVEFESRKRGGRYRLSDGVAHAARR